MPEEGRNFLLLASPNQGSFESLVWSRWEGTRSLGVVPAQLVAEALHRDEPAPGLLGGRRGAARKRGSLPRSWRPPRGPDAPPGTGPGEPGKKFQQNVARFRLYRHRSLQVGSFGFNFICSGSPQNYPNPAPRPLRPQNRPFSNNEPHISLYASLKKRF